MSFEGSTKSAGSLSLRSKTPGVEAREYNLLFRWFPNRNFTDPTWANLTDAKKQQRLLEQGSVRDIHFRVDGSLIEAWASLKSVAPKQGSAATSDRDAGNPSVDFRGQLRTEDTR